MPHVGPFAVARAFGGDSPPVLSVDRRVSIPSGKLSLLLGAAGSGKTVFLETLAGVLPKDLEAVGHCGHSFARCRNSVAYISSDFPLISDLTVKETLLEWCKLDPQTRRISRHERKARVYEVLERTGLTKVQDNIVGGPWTAGLSKESQFLLKIAIRLLSRPSVLLVDAQQAAGLHLTVRNGPPVDADGNQARPPVLPCASGPVLETLAKIAKDGAADRSLAVLVASPVRPFFEIARQFNGSLIALTNSGHLGYYSPNFDLAAVHSFVSDRRDLLFTSSFASSSSSPSSSSSSSSSSPHSSSRRRPIQRTPSANSGPLVWWSSAENSPVLSESPSFAHRDSTLSSKSATSPFSESPPVEPTIWPPRGGTAPSSSNRAALPPHLEDCNNDVTGISDHSLADPESRHLPHPLYPLQGDRKLDDDLDPKFQIDGHFHASRSPVSSAQSTPRKERAAWRRLRVTGPVTDEEEAAAKISPSSSSVLQGDALDLLMELLSNQKLSDSARSPSASDSITVGHPAMNSITTIPSLLQGMKHLMRDSPQSTAPSPAWSAPEQRKSFNGKFQHPQGVMPGTDEASRRKAENAGPAIPDSEDDDFDFSDFARRNLRSRKRRFRGCSCSCGRWLQSLLRRSTSYPSPAAAAAGAKVSPAATTEPSLNNEGSARATSSLAPGVSAFGDKPPQRAPRACSRIYWWIKETFEISKRTFRVTLRNFWHLTFVLITHLIIGLAFGYAFWGLCEKPDVQMTIEQTLTDISLSNSSWVNSLMYGVDGQGTHPVFDALTRGVDGLGSQPIEDLIRRAYEYLSERGDAFQIRETVRCVHTRYDISSLGYPPISWPIVVSTNETLVDDFATSVAPPTTTMATFTTTGDEGNDKDTTNNTGWSWWRFGRRRLEQERAVHEHIELTGEYRQGTAVSNSSHSPTRSLGHGADENEEGSVAAAESVEDSRALGQAVQTLETTNDTYEQMMGALMSAWMTHQQQWPDANAFQFDGHDATNYWKREGWRCGESQAPKRDDQELQRLLLQGIIRESSFLSHRYAQRNGSSPSSSDSIGGVALLKTSEGSTAVHRILEELTTTAEAPVVGADEEQINQDLVNGQKIIGDVVAVAQVGDYLLRHANWTAVGKQCWDPFQAGNTTGFNFYLCFLSNGGEILSPLLNCALNVDPNVTTIKTLNLDWASLATLGFWQFVWKITGRDWYSTSSAAAASVASVDKDDKDDGNKNSNRVLNSSNSNIAQLENFVPQRMQNINNIEDDGSREARGKNSNPDAATQAPASARRKLWEADDNWIETLLTFLRSAVGENIYILRGVMDMVHRLVRDTCAHPVCTGLTAIMKTLALSVEGTVSYLINAMARGSVLFSMASVSSFVAYEKVVWCHDEAQIHKRDVTENALTSVSAHFFGTMIGNLVLEVLPAVALSTLVFFLSGFVWEGRKFGVYFGLTGLLAWSAYGWAVLVQAMTGNRTGVTLFTLSLLSVIFAAFGGFFIRLPTVGRGVSWIGNLSVCKWIYDALLLNEFPTTEPEANGVAHSHEFMLRFLGISTRRRELWQPAVVALSIAVSVRLLALVIIKIRVRASCKHERKCCYE